MKLLSIFLITALCVVSALAQSHASVDWSDFKSDGCTWWPDKNYIDCCVEHDRAYFRGGSRRERRIADDRLYQCVLSKDRSVNKHDARLMWLGVRIGGMGWLPTPFRWGFGQRYWENNAGWARGISSETRKRK